MQNSIGSVTSTDSGLDQGSSVLNGTTASLLSFLLVVVITNTITGSTHTGEASMLLGYLSTTQCQWKCARAPRLGQDTPGPAWTTRSSTPAGPPTSSPGCTG